MDKQDKIRWEKEAEKLVVQPDDRVWTRLEQRLNQDQNKVPVEKIRRWMGIAASLLVMVSFGVYFLSNVEMIPTDEVVIHDLEESAPKVTYAAYRHVSDINGFYESEGWKQINEGNHTSLVVSIDQLRLNPAAISVTSEDTLY